MRKTLRLRRETLSELTGAQLLSVAGGASDTCTYLSCLTLCLCEVPTLPVRTCFDPH